MTCSNCGRETCMVPHGRATRSMSLTEFQEALKQQRKDRADCRAHTVDWHARAHAAEAKLAAAEATVAELQTANMGAWKQVGDEFADLLELEAKHEAAEAEIVRLTNAAKSRLKCPQGHAPRESRVACWFCDAEKNAATVARVRKLGEAWTRFPGDDGKAMTIRGRGADLIAILDGKVTP